MKLFQYFFYPTLFLFLLFAHWQVADYAFDDAYIHFRIAENLLFYGEPYFNRGERVMVTSSPVYTLVLTFLFAVFGVSKVGPVFFNSLIVTLCCCVYSLLAKSLLSRKNIVIDLLVSILVFVVLFNSSAGLMETPLALLLFGIGTLLYQKDRSVAMLPFGLAIFVRLELVVAFALIVLHAVTYKKVRSWSWIANVCIAVLPPLLWTFYSFGTLIPNTIAAKNALYSLEPNESFLMISANYFGIWDGAGILALLSLLWFLISVAIVCFYFKSSDNFRHKQTPLILGMFSLGLLIMIAYIWKSTVIFPWYSALYTLPLIYSLFLMAYSGGRVPMLLFFCLCSPLLIGAGTDVRAVFSEISSYRYFKEGARARTYIQLGNDLYNSRPSASLMTSEIGGLGFGFKGYIWDGVGLASPDAIKHHPLTVPQERNFGGDGALPLAYVKEKGPDLIVTLPSLLQKNSELELAQFYEKRSVPVFLQEDADLLPPHADIWGNTRIDIYYDRK